MKEATKQKSPERHRAVVASDGNGRGCVMFYESSVFEYEMEEFVGDGSLASFGLSDAPAGVSIWEGTFRYVKDMTPEGIDEGGFHEMESGSFSELTDDQWDSLRKGEDPLGAD